MLELATLWYVIVTMTNIECSYHEILPFKSGWSRKRSRYLRPNWKGALPLTFLTLTFLTFIDFYEENEENLKISAANFPQKRGLLFEKITYFWSCAYPALSSFLLLCFASKHKFWYSNNLALDVNNWDRIADVFYGWVHKKGWFDAQLSRKMMACVIFL